MTESALTARLKLRLRRQRPMEGGLGETIAPGLGFTGAGGLMLRPFSFFFVFFFVSFFVCFFMLFLSIFGSILGGEID